MYPHLDGINGVNRVNNAKKNQSFKMEQETNLQDVSIFNKISSTTKKAVSSAAKGAQVLAHAATKGASTPSTMDIAKDT